MSKTIAFQVATFAVDQERRTLTGLLIPFGVVSDPAMDGKRYTVTKDTLTANPETDVVLNYGHDGYSLTSQIGIATNLDVQDDGVHATFQVADTPQGDIVLALAGMKPKPVLRAFSAEIEGEFEEKDGVQHAKTFEVVGGAVVRRGAFKDAQITSVAASAAQNKETSMTETATEETKVSASKDVAALMADVEKITTELAELKKVKIPVGPGTAQFQVTEEPIYRFAGDTPAPSGFDFATDLLAAARDGDKAALARVKEYSAQRVHEVRFADQPTTTGDTAGVNPSQYRPDLFLGQAPTPRSPLFDFFFKGVRNDVTPFFWSKLDRANTDVGVADHTEGVEPESRDIVTTAGATVTPAPVSGKVHITREVGDQGGNPSISGMIRSEFDRSYSIALETKTAALVLASSAAELGAAITAGATDGAAVGDIVERGLIGLQFLADGFRFEKAFGHVDLYTLLAMAKDGDDRKLYPILNPQNANGTASSKWAALSIGGWSMAPTASLGATDTNKKSYVADPFAVHVWASGLQRLDKLQEDVEGWDIGCFGYFAGIVYDVTGLRKITYDPTA